MFKVRIRIMHKINGRDCLFVTLKIYGTSMYVQYNHYI